MIQHRKHLAPYDRPREKLERAGTIALGDNELMAVLLGHGNAHDGALALADRILDAAAGLHGLTRCTRDELALIPGVGRAQAGRILAAIELGRRTLSRPPHERPRLHSAREAGDFLLPQFGAHPVERFGAALLDARHRLLGTRLLTIGGIDESLVQPRDVFRVAMLGGACAILVFHNHPSGDPTPSREDMQLTSRLVRAGAVVGVSVVDHLILAGDRYVSLREAHHPAWLEWDGRVG